MIGLNMLIKNGVINKIWDAISIPYEYNKII